MEDDIQTLVGRYKGVLLDAYGVFWGGNGVGPLPGAIEAMARLVFEGRQVGILTNATQLGSAEEEKLAKHGICKGSHFHFILSSGDLTRGILCEKGLPFATPRNTYTAFGGAHPNYSSHTKLFEETGYREVSDPSLADFAYLVTPHLNGVDQTEPELFREPLSRLKIPMVCANPDLFAHEGNPPKLVVRQGALAKMYQEMGGEVFFIGKPSTTAFLAALKMFQGLDRAEIVMVGDTPETDVRGANASGIDSILLTETGVMAHRSVDDLSDHPTHLAKRLGRCTG